MGLAIHMGLGKCKRNVKENLANGVVINNVVNGTPGVNNGANGGYESEDEEVSFSPRLGEKETSDTEETGGRPDRKRKRVEVQPLVKESRTSSETAWNDGQFNCQLCDKSFRTPTFLLQHYVSPHFRNELRSEFSVALASKKCCLCSASFDNDAKLMMHLGATHREVIKYLPSGVTIPSSTRSPVKRATTSTVEDPLQKFLATALGSQQQQQQDENGHLAGGNPGKQSSSRTSSSNQSESSSISPKRSTAKDRDASSDPPPVKRSPGRPPGFPNKVKKDKT